MSSLLETIQRDLHARLAAEPYFADLDVVLARPREKLGFTQIQSQIDTLLAGQRKVGGKCGAALSVLMPDAAVADPNAPGPRLDITFTVRCLEIPVINMGPSGTLKSVEELALRVLQLGHHFNAGRGAVLYGRDLVPLPAAGDDPRLGIDVSFTLKTGAEAYPKLARPLVVASQPAAPATVTLTGPAGATVLYTLDGSYPVAGAAGTSTYTAPFAVATAAEIRALSTQTGYQQSDIHSLTLN